jgi:hypothetical protein
MTRYQLVCSLNKITVIAAAVAMSGTAVTDVHFGDTSLSVERLSRPFGIGLWQIERCLFQEGPRDRLALSSTFVEIDYQCPIEQKR